jgi:hypothetical protein
MMIESGLHTRMEDLPTSIVNSIYANALVAGRWAMCGYPTITMGHRTAAAFCSTKMRPEDATEFVRSPWPAFVVRLPNGLFFVEDHGRMREAEVLIATCLKANEVPMSRENAEQYPGEDRWWWKLCAASDLKRPDWMDPNAASIFDGISLWGFNMPTHSMADPDGGEGEDGYIRWETQTTEDSDRRTERLCRSLLLAVCMYLSGDPRERAERASESGVTVRERKSKQREGDELPQYTSFEVQSSIKLDLHHAIRDYVHKGGSVPSVQTLVHGHWKRVAIGVGRTGRKLVHIQPYWRGDINAPISVRAK